MRLEAEVEQVIRALDLCVSCATHEVKLVDMDSNGVEHLVARGSK